MNRTYSHFEPPPNTGIQINRVRFWEPSQAWIFKYDEKLNRLYDKPLPPDTTKYVPKSRMISPNNRPFNHWWYSIQ